LICSPSFLTADFSKIAEEIKSISQAKWIHFDVMDGKFVENTTYDHNMLLTIKEFSNQFFDVHLMIEEPEKHFMKYINNGANTVTFHYEATDNPLALLKKIRENNVLAGISIKPNTNVSVLNELLPYLDIILIMSVEPGKGGQKFMPEALEKIDYLNQKRLENNYNYLIEVDGGINNETVLLVKKVNCDVIVAGSFIFNHKDRNKVIKELENV
jgi:ribulose-phosphate 3-epimerase